MKKKEKEKEEEAVKRRNQSEEERKKEKKKEKREETKAGFGLRWKGEKKKRLRFFYRSRALFTGPVSTDFSKFFFKTGSHDTIHIFKNSLITIFSVFNNKRYSNKP